MLSPKNSKYIFKLKLRMKNKKKIFLAKTDKDILKIPMYSNQQDNSPKTVKKNYENPLTNKKSCSYSTKTLKFLKLILLITKVSAKSVKRSV